uniref:Non-haem dioxygenase N-terminal domain-containing protein n=1 Tax=Chenopodium quinoa TaxID=63459 RepID=A0A803MG72_CHEQI
MHRQPNTNKNCENFVLFLIHGVAYRLLVNHGKELFALPLEQKQKHNTTLDWFEGYGGATISEGQNYNWNDRLHLRVNPVDQRNFNFWPEYILNFRETLEEYAVEVRRVTKSLLKAIAKSVELDEDSFLKECGEDEAMNLFTRFNYYTYTYIHTDDEKWQTEECGAQGCD